MVYDDEENPGYFPKVEIPFVTDTDWKLTYHVKWVSGSYFEGGLFFDAVSLEDFFGYYLFPAAWGTDALSLHYFYNKTNSPQVASTPHTWLKNVWYNITVERVSDNILAFVNDSLKINVTHAEPSVGNKFGFHCGSYTHENILFDNISIFVDGITNRMPFMFDPVDINYSLESTGHSISWIPSDNDPSSYNITRNGVLVKEGLWNSTGEIININVDGLTSGSYTYRCSVYDNIGQSFYDEVNVTVINEYLDQEYPEENQDADGGVGWIFSTLFDDAQGFTPNITGYLSSIELFLLQN